MNSFLSFFLFLFLVFGLESSVEKKERKDARRLKMFIRISSIPVKLSLLIKIYSNKIFGIARLEVKWRIISSSMMVIWLHSVDLSGLSES